MLVSRVGSPVHWEEGIKMTGRSKSETGRSLGKQNKEDGSSSAEWPPFS